MSSVLGVNCYLHDSSVALIQDGRLTFAAEEERFSRIKKDARFPRLAIKSALNHVSLLSRVLARSSVTTSRNFSLPSSSSLTLSG